MPGGGLGGGGRRIRKVQEGEQEVNGGCKLGRRMDGKEVHGDEKEV